MKDEANILITISGPDRAGITANLMEIIAKSGYKILDMGQAVTHGLLSLSILIANKTKRKEAGPPILKELLFAAKEMHVHLDFKIISSTPQKMPEGIKFILSCVAKKLITPDFLLQISQGLANFNINILRIDNINNGRNFKSVEITTLVPAHVDLKEIKSNLLESGRAHQTDIAFMKESNYRRPKRLIVFDMDSTLIQTEVIDEMAKAHGVGEKVGKITARAMNGELSFEESLVHRARLLKGLKAKQMDKILATLPLTVGVKKFIKKVKGLGLKVAIISGGFSFFADPLKQKLGIDYVFANQLEFKDGELTGKVKGPVIDAKQKAVLLDLIAQQEKITLDQVVAIGDGANDLPMLSKAGLGIAFHAKDIVKKQADNQMSFGPMTSILYFLGIPEEE